MIFDTHTHYDDERYDPDRDEVIAKCANEDVGLILNVGADFKGCEDSIELAAKHDIVYAAVGVHPHYADQMSEEKLAWLEDLCSQPKVVAFGEIGLDYYYENSDKEAQRFWFKKQLELANKLDLPVIIHDRDAHQDVMDALTEYVQYAKNPRGVIHCFSGSAELAQQMVALGFHIAFGGAITFKNARRALEACEVVPLDKILLETDCPYLSPEPFRGQRNDSTRIKYISQKIGGIKGKSSLEIERICYENGKNLFKI